MWDLLVLQYLDWRFARLERAADYYRGLLWQEPRYAVHEAKAVAAMASVAKRIEVVKHRL